MIENHDDVPNQSLPDEHDQAAAIELLHRDRAIGAARSAAAAIPEGEPGECSHCGYMKPRLVRGACAVCRDEFNLP